MAVAALDWAQIGRDQEPGQAAEPSTAGGEKVPQENPLACEYDVIIGSDLVYSSSSVEPLSKASTCCHDLSFGAFFPTEKGFVEKEQLSLIPVLCCHTFFSFIGVARCFQKVP